jgi:hypothetical protein
MKEQNTVPQQVLIHSIIRQCQNGEISIEEAERRLAGIGWPGKYFDNHVILGQSYYYFALDSVAALNGNALNLMRCVCTDKMWREQWIGVGYNTDGVHMDGKRLVRKYLNELKANPAPAKPEDYDFNLIEIRHQHDKAMFDLQKEHEKRMDEIAEKYGHIRPIAPASIRNILLSPQQGEAFWSVFNAEKPKPIVQSPEAAAHEKAEKEKARLKRLDELNYILKGLIKEAAEWGNPSADALVGVQKDIGFKYAEISAAIAEREQLLKEGAE